MPAKPITPTSGNCTRSPRKRIGMLNGMHELARAQRILQAQSDQRDEHERVAGRSAERVQVGQHVQARFAVEEAVVDRADRRVERRQRREDEHRQRDAAEREDRDDRRAVAGADALEDGRQQTRAAHRVGDARGAEHAGVRRDQQQHGAQHRDVQRGDRAEVRHVGGEHGDGGALVLGVAEELEERLRVTVRVGRHRMRGRHARARGSRRRARRPGWSGSARSRCAG